MNTDRLVDLLMPISMFLLTIGAVAFLLSIAYLIANTVVRCAQ